MAGQYAKTSQTENNSKSNRRQSDNLQMRIQTRELILRALKWNGSVFLEEVLCNNHGSVLLCQTLNHGAIEPKQSALTHWTSPGMTQTDLRQFGARIVKIVK